MEAFSLLKYWRPGAGASSTSSAAANSRSTTTTTTTIATSAFRPSTSTEEEDYDADDDGPFIDLEFSVPDEDRDGEDEDGENDDASAESDEREFNFTMSSEGSFGGGLRSDRSLSLSPSDDLFFRGRLVPIEPSSLLYTTSEPNSKSQFPISLLKSATKFRVFMLRFKKPKPTSPKSNSATAAAASPKQQQQQSKFFTVKFKVEEVPIMSLFTRDNSSRSSISGGGRSQKQHTEYGTAAAAAGSEERRFSRDVVQKYLSKIKPLYGRASRRYSEKLRFSAQHNGGDADGGEMESPANSVKRQKPQNLPAGLRVVCKRLRKSRSASSAVAAVPSPPTMQAQRRDDSLLQQEDGIQSAIAHCKRSFTGARGSESPLFRSRSSSDSCDSGRSGADDFCVITSSDHQSKGKCM